MQPLPVVENYLALPWDGGNGQDIVDALNTIYPTAGYALTSEGETEVVMTPTGEGFDVQTLDLGGAVVVKGNEMQGGYPMSAYTNLFRPAGLARLSAAGVADVPALTLLDPSAVVQVAISPTQPDTTFTPHAALVGAAGDLTVDDVEVVSTSRVDVTVTASVAYLAGAQVLVWVDRG